MTQFTTISDATLVPVRVKKDGPPGAMIGGAFDGNGDYVDQSAFFRGDRRFVYRPRAPTSAADGTIGEQAIFAGYLYNHFGHFLLESLSRLHVLPQCPDAPLLWVKEREMKPWHQDIFRILGVQNRHIFVTEPARVRSLVVGNCGFSIGNYFRPYHERFLGKVEWQPISGRWIWLSRSKLAADLGGIDNETDIEAVLSLNGWTIFHAQEHSLEQQVKILSDAERIAGFEGSAFHLLVLLDQIHARIDIFSRGSSINRNFDLIAQAKRLDQRVHGVAMEQISGARSFSRYRIGDLDEVVAKLAAA
ncbi:glycosyltransferase family 61 protein [Sphingobium sp.]|uniref:glycosyltransferase family 61 protein n=1 Tax=Sphingobium sp. TaxID=1912891 RepID=UPI00262D98E7|nr:glycosyltransferase family 61 protein [Sphingobium sp.]